MMTVIEKLVMDAFGGDTYGKALECLRVLRDTCKKFEYEDVFNAWLRSFKEKICDEDALGRLAVVSPATLDTFRSSAAFIESLVWG